MELTVARLKVLGEKDIADLDKKIAEYRATNNPTILNKDLETIQREMFKLSEKYTQLSNEIIGIRTRHTNATKQRDKFNDDMKQMEEDLQKMMAEMDEIFIQQADYETGIAAKKAEVDKCCSELATQKQKLAEVLEAHKTQDAEYQANLKVIRESVSRVEDEIREHRQRAYQRYLDYEAAVKEVSLDAVTSRNPVNSSFAEMVPDLLQVLARNMGNYLKVREYYNGAFRGLQYNSLESCSDNIKNTLTNMHQYLCGDVDKNCNCKCGTIMGKYGPNTYYMASFCGLLYDKYKEILNHIIRHSYNGDAKLNAIIQNTTYAELFDMLGSVFDIKGYNTYEFILFLAFLETGGKAHNLYNEF